MRWLADLWNEWVEGPRWRRWFLLVWFAIATWMLWERWRAIGWFALPDTDDNLRMVQVRDLLAGQSWFDLRQYRLDPPGGASIHWSRLVDLPIAGLMLLFRPMVGGLVAERIAVAGAPLLALGAGLYATMLSCRRLVGPQAAWLSPAILLFAGSTLAMWKPLRIDHHGWQLAFLMTMVAGIADARRARGGAVMGAATTASLAIGLELMPYMALGGALTMLWWVADPAERPRVQGYAAALALGAAIGWLLFVSRDNARPVCDAFSPVWLSAVLAAAALALALMLAPVGGRLGRFGLTALVGGVLAAGFALAWPDCLGRPEHLSPELTRDWFANVREAKPVYLHGWRIALTTLALPLVGAAGALWALWRQRSAPWAIVAVLSCAATALLFWQTRAGPAAQLLAVPGATALGLWLAGVLWRIRPWPLSAAAAAAAFMLVSGAWASWTVQATPAPVSKVRRLVNAANARCPSFPALRPLAALPPATILTFVDLGPRLLVATHHAAIAGPYHRNAAAILDIHRAFRSVDPAVAHDAMRRHGATLLLVCPYMSESTLYMSQDPKGFYMQLMRGQVPAWLAPEPLPAGSPFRLWRRVD